MSRDDTYLLDMLVRARKVQAFVAPVIWEEFAANETLQLAVVHLVQEIGEAAANVSAELRQQHTAIPWHQIVGMRNLIVHRYWEVDLLRVWDTVQDHIPALIAALEPLVSREDQ